MDKKKITPLRPSKAYEEAYNDEQEASKKLEELEKKFEELQTEKTKWTKILEDSRRRKEYLSKTRQRKKSPSPRRKPAAMSVKSPAKQTRNDNSQLLNTGLNNDGELVQVFDESQNASSGASAGVANVEGQANRELSPPLSELPQCENYDPIQCVAPHRVSTALKDLDKAFNELYFHPTLPENNIKVPSKETAESNTFFLFKLPDDKKERIKAYIEELGGTIADGLESATRVVFYPSKKHFDDEELFFLGTAAAGGRFILTAFYIVECYDAKKFLNPADYSTYEYYHSKHNFDPKTFAIIKMSVEFRQSLAKSSIPCFNLHNILFAEPKGTHVDVMLFLRICGAFVQPFYGIKDKDKEWISNWCITLVVNSGKVPLFGETYDLRRSPVTTPDSIRNILWQALNQFTE